MASLAAPGAAPGMLLADGAHLLSGVALALSFLLLYQQRIRAMVRAYVLQALSAALVAALHGWSRGAAAPLLGSLLLAAGAVAMPVVLRRQAGLRQGQGSPVRAADEVGAGVPDGVLPSGTGAVASMAIGVAVVAIAVFAVQAAPLPGPGTAAPTREDLAFALAVVLLGLLGAASRGHPSAQAIGVLSMWNGLVLAAASVTDLAALAAGSAGLLAPAAAVAFGTPILTSGARVK